MALKYELYNMSISGLDIDRLESAANMLKAIAHPMRIAILNLLDENERLSVSEIYQKLGIEQAAASHHLGILKDKGILLSKREGKNTFYALKHENFSKVVDCIGNCPLH